MTKKLLSLATLLFLIVGVIPTQQASATGVLDGYDQNNIPVGHSPFFPQENALVDGQAMISSGITGNKSCF